MPRAALAATGIGSIEVGTEFPEQTIGSGAAFAAATAGTILNLMATNAPALKPFVLKLEGTGAAFTAGVTYTFSLLGSDLTISGSDGSSSTAVLAAEENGDTTHTFVGMAVHTSDLATVPLYPLLALTFPAPAVGTNGVLQGAAYSVRLTFGERTCTYDIVDDTQTIIGSRVSVPTPEPTDGSSPQGGDLYFGSFTGGAASVTRVVGSGLSRGGGGRKLPGSQLQRHHDPRRTGQRLARPTSSTITDSSLFVYSNINIDTGEDRLGELGQRLSSPAR